MTLARARGHTCGGLMRRLPVASGAKGGSGPVLVPRPRAVYLVGSRVALAVLGVEVAREAVFGWEWAWSWVLVLVLG